MDGASPVAATTQLGQQLFGIISATRAVIKDFKSAAEDHKTLSQEFSSIFKIIEFTGDVLQRAAGRLTDGELKNALKGENIEPLLGGIRKSIVDAQNILDKHKALRVRDKFRLIMDKGDIREAQARLSNAGIHLSMFLTSLLVDGVAGGSSQAPLTEVLTVADVKARLDEVLNSVKEEIKLDVRGKGKDSNSATHTNSEQPQEGATKKWLIKLEKRPSIRSLNRSKGPKKQKDRVQRRSSALSKTETKSRPQTAPANPVAVPVPDAGSAKRTSKNQDTRREDSLNNDAQGEPSHILREGRMSSTRVSDESRSSPPVQSSETGLETQSFGISSDPAPQHAPSTKDGATQTSPVSVPFIEKENDDEISIPDIETEELLGCNKSPNQSSSPDAGDGACYSSSESPQESRQFSRWMNLVFAKTQGLIFSNEKFLDMLNKTDLRGEGHSSSDATRNVTQAPFADTTWITALVMDGCCDNENGKDDDDCDDDQSHDDNERHGVLVFQRPDNWLQLAKIPRDHKRPASMLCPIVEAMENTPISSRLICHGDHRHTLRLYFFMDQSGGGPQLSICTITHAPTIINAAWDVQKLQLSCGDDLPPPMPGMGFFEDPFRERLSYASSSGLLISLYETDDGEWKTYSYPEKVLVRPGDQVFHTVHCDEPSLYLWRYRQDDSTVTEFSGYNHFAWLDPYVKGVTTTKRLNWHGLTLDQSSIPCLPILDGCFDVGLICKTLGDNIYLFKGDPWHDTHDEPIHLCKVKSGTNISLSQDLRDLLFISTENELSRIRIQVSGSEITFTQPCPIFPKDSFSARLDAISFPGFIFGPKFTNKEDGESPTSSSSSSWSLGSEGARFTVSHRTDGY